MQMINFYNLIHEPAHQLVEKVYLAVLGRTPSFSEHAHHLTRLKRGYSRKVFVLSVLYSPEGRARNSSQQLSSAGPGLFWFDRLAGGSPVRTKIMLRLLRYLDVVTGRASWYAAQFQAEWQLNVWQEWQEQRQSLRTETHILQQDVQRRVDLFLLEIIQCMSAETLSQAEIDVWRRQLEQAGRNLHY